jgi:hypothetical protein
MEALEYNKLRNNRGTRKSIVHVERENGWYKIGSNWTVLGINEAFREHYRETYMSKLTFGDKKSRDEYTIRRETEWNKIVESLEIGKSTDPKYKGVMAGYAYQ